jgi:hypothetical protein
MGNGGSVVAREEISVSEYENAATAKRKERIVFTLQPNIVHVQVNGKTEATLSFKCAKEFDALQGGDHPPNVMGAIYRSLKVEQGETAVITKIERLSVVNEMPVFDVNFDLVHVFDEDPEKQAIRRRIDESIQADALSSTRVTVLPGPLGRHHPRDQDLNEGFRLDASSDTESVSSSSNAVMDTLADNPDERLFNGATTARQVYAQIDQMSIRGRSAFRSEEERLNRISLGSVGYRSKSFEPVVLYESSAKERLIALFAGQEKLVVDNAAAARKIPTVTVTGEPVLSRADSYALYPSDSPLLCFVDMFADLLEVSPADLQVLNDDRGNISKRRWFRIQNGLVEKARDRFILIMSQVSVSSSSMKSPPPFSQIYFPGLLHDDSRLFIEACCQTLCGKGN